MPTFVAEITGIQSGGGDSDYTYYISTTNGNLMTFSSDCVIEGSLANSASESCSKYPVEATCSYSKPIGNNTYNSSFINGYSGSFSYNKI